MIIEHLGAIDNHNNNFLVSINKKIEDLKNSNNIVILGTGILAMNLTKLLQQHDISIYAYADNNIDFQNQELNNKPVYSPYELFDTNVHFIIAVNPSSISTVRMQFMVYNIKDYSIYINEHFGEFHDKDLLDVIMNSINKLCYEDESYDDALPLSAWSSGELLGELNSLLKSTEWSHPVYNWQKEIIKNSPEVKILEIGPGYGLMSQVLLTQFNKLCIDWFIMGNKETKYTRYLNKIQDSYSQQIHSIYGCIELEDEIPSKYDFIVMTEVFEHFALNPIHTLTKIKNALKDNGKIFFSTPNWGHLYIYKSWKELPNFTDVSIDRYYELLKCGHVYQYSKEELSEIFTQSGLKIEKYEVSISNNHNYLLSKI